MDKDKDAFLRSFIPALYGSFGAIECDVNRNQIWRRCQTLALIVHDELAKRKEWEADRLSWLRFTMAASICNELAHRKGLDNKVLIRHAIEEAERGWKLHEVWRKKQ